MIRNSSATNDKMLAWCRSHQMESFRQALPSSLGPWTSLLLSLPWGHLLYSALGTCHQDRLTTHLPEESEASPRLLPSSQNDRWCPQGFRFPWSSHTMQRVDQAAWSQMELAPCGELLTNQK